MPKTKKFRKLLSSVKKQYLGKEVPSKYRSKYGKSYDKEEVKRIAYAIAQSRGWRI